MKKVIISLIIILAAAHLGWTNPIPIPPPANMPLEEMRVVISADSTGGLEAAFSGDFTFTHIPQDVNSMLFPVPPDANNIRVWQDNVELPWNWSNGLYPTVLPEWPMIPMFGWQGPFPVNGAVFRVEYKHNLIKRPQESIFFYAVGTGKYFPTYEKTTTAYFDIALPDGFTVSGVWLDKIPHDYKVIGSHLFVTVQSYFGPIKNDLIVSLVPPSRKVNFADFAGLASRWLDAGCGWPDWCDGADRSRNGAVEPNDLGQFADSWLKSQEDEPYKPGLAGYYQPYSNDITPNAPGYTLPIHIGNVGNYPAMNSRFGLSGAVDLLEQNGFAVIEFVFSAPDCNRDDIVKPYECLYRMDVPLFITSDTLLHLYHIQFDETLKEIEEREFYGDIRELTAVLLDNALAAYDQYSGDLKEAAKRNVAYLAVARKLIDPNTQVPPLVAGLVAGELAKIDAHTGFATSDIFIYQEDYSQYVPRGHYTRSELLKKYFKTLMWYGRMAFILKGHEIWGPTGLALISPYDAKIQTMQAVLLAESIEQVQLEGRRGRKIWDRIYAVTAFYVGLADDLTPYEYLGAISKVFGSSFKPTDLEDENSFFALKAELTLLRSPKINGGTGNAWVTLPITPNSLNEVLDKTKGMRFMGQRFIPDSYMFQQLVTPQVRDYIGDGNPIPFTYGTTPIGPHRCYPRGLDVMAILGSQRAKTLLIEEGDTDFVDYSKQFDKLKAEFDAFGIADWNQNLYWAWLYSLRSLLEGFPQGYPNFMRTQAWQKKELNAALASWTQLRHDTILYAKQSYAPPPTGYPPPPPPGYVEPVPEFYGRLLALTQMTREGLSDFNALSTQAATRLTNLENILSRLIELSNKELTGQPLSESDYQYIKSFGKTLETAIIGVDETGAKTSLVADVHTYGYEKLVVEEGVGYVDLIIVACPGPGGSIYLSAGPVFSYYEFKQPMSDRLTDEAWRQMLASPQRPARPTWFQSLIH